MNVFAAIALLALVASGFAADPPCTANSYDSIYTPCKVAQGASVKTRNKVYYRSEACCDSCDGAVPQPASDYNLPCDCDAGQQRAEDGTCQSCDAGYFNPGGDHYDGKDWQAWNASRYAQGVSKSLINPAPGVFLLCEGMEGCDLWGPEPDGTTLSSGNNANVHSIHTSFVIMKEFVRDSGNAVQFQYRVDTYCYGTSGCDGFQFYIDGQRVLPAPGARQDVVAAQPKFQTFEYTDKLLTPGVHELKWVYRKNAYTSWESDKAYVKAISLIGAVDQFGMTSSQCEMCPTGTISAAPGSSKCTECDWFEHQPTAGKAQCMPCGEDAISTPGSSVCIPLRNCTADDMYTLKTTKGIGACTLNAADNKYYYSEVSDWIQVAIPGKSPRRLCKPVTPLPNDGKVVNNAGVCTCAPGQELVVKDGKPVCRDCPVGSYSENNMTSCQTCKAGFITIPDTTFVEWSSDIPTQPIDAHDCGTPDTPYCTTCVGDCTTNGFVPRGKYTSSGRSIGSSESQLVIPNLNVQGPSTLRVNCITDCRLSTDDTGQAAPDDCFLNFRVSNGSALLADFNCTSRVYTNQKRVIYERSVDLKTMPGDMVTVTATFHQVTKSKASVFEGMIYKVALENTYTGGASKCTLCPVGTRSDSLTNTCVPCAAGTESTFPPTDVCTPCKDGYFSRGGEMCKMCGVGTNALPDKSGCDVGKCEFVGKVSSRSYALGKLGSPDDEMIAAVSNEYASTFVYYINPCYTTHKPTVCIDANNKSLPYMACQRTKEKTYNIGSVLGFEESAEGEFKLSFTQGDGPCWTGANRETIINMHCDLTAGRGTPQKAPGRWSVEAPTCHYELEWYSEFACPVCRSIEDYQMALGPCRNGMQEIQYIKTGNCSGTRPSETQECRVATYDELPPAGRVYVAAKVRLNSEKDGTFFATRLAAALNMSGVSETDILVIDQIDTMIGFRVDLARRDKLEAKVRAALPAALAKASLGKLEDSIVSYPPEGSSGVNKGGVAAAVIIVIALLIATGYLIYRNRQLKYQNYRLVKASGGMGVTNDLFEDNHQLGSGGPAVLQTSHEDDAFDPRA